MYQKEYVSRITLVHAPISLQLIRINLVVVADIGKVTRTKSQGNAVYHSGVTPSSPPDTPLLLLTYSFTMSVYARTREYELRILTLKVSFNVGVHK